MKVGTTSWTPLALVFERAETVCRESTSLSAKCVRLKSNATSVTVMDSNWEARRLEVRPLYMFQAQCPFFANDIRRQTETLHGADMNWRRHMCVSRDYSGLVVGT